MDDLYTKIEEGTYSIEIKKTRRGRFPVLNKGEERTQTKEEDDTLRDMMKRYKDTILTLYDINEEYSGNERAWRLGQEMSAVDKDDQAKVGTLFKILPIQRFSNSSAYRYRLFYEAFPEKEGSSEKEYNSSHKHTILSELVQRVKGNDEMTRYERAREVYGRVREQPELSQDQIRAWSTIESTNPSQQEVVDAVTERIQNPNVVSVRIVYKLLGETPPEEEIKQLLREEE